MSADKPALRMMIRDWAPGYLDTPEADTLPGGATPDAKNAWFTNIYPAGTERKADLAKRPGTRLLNPTVMDASAKVDGLFEFRRSGQPRQLLAVCNGKLQAYDDVSAFAQVGATAPFTAGNLAKMIAHRDRAYVFDGSVLKRYDGAALDDVGQVAPTSVTNPTAAVPVGAGVTGTYEAVYTWYSTTLAHESSISAKTAAVVCAAQARHHTKPGGAPGALYDEWKIYVRRTDTNETKFALAGTAPIASGTYNEETADDVRIDLAPASGENDPPPGPWKLLEQWGGFFFGVQASSSQFSVSKINEPDSWNPRDIFAVQKGDGEDLSGIKLFGADILLQKPHATWRLVGTAVPFTIEPAHSRYGGVGASSGGEVDGRFFDWDRERGPYVTDLVNWTALADGRIRTLVESVNRNVLSDIRFLHVEGKGLVGWAFASQGSTRKRTIVWYSYLLNAWLPPWTGLEYASLCPYTDTAGLTGYYVGDAWGRVYQLFSGDREGIPTTTPLSTFSAAITGAAADSVTAATASFYTTGSGLVGMPVAVISPAGVWQWRRIASNTGTQITLDTTHDAPFTTVPATDGTWTVVVGGIEWYHWTPWFDAGRPEITKIWRFLFLQGKVTSSDHNVNVYARFNDDEGTSTAQSYAFPTGTLTGVWGTAVWGISLWGFTSRRMRKKRVDRSSFTAQFQLSNFYPDQPVTITALGLTADFNETGMVASQ